MSEEDYNIDLDTLINKLQSLFSDQQILFFSTTKNVIKITVNEIKYLTSDNNHINLFLTNGSSVELPEALEYYKSSLEKHKIIQINDNTLINTEKIEKILITEEKIFVTGGEALHIANQYSQKLLNILNKIDN